MAPFSNLDPARYRLPERAGSDLLTPCLVVWIDKVRRNVAQVIDALGGTPDRWRPHLKTTKLPPLWDELVREGVRHFKVATTREARVLLQSLARSAVEGDVLVAYPLLGPNLAALGKLAETHSRCRLSVLVEDLTLLPEISPHLGLFIDINPGMDRTGIPIDQTHRILTLARAAGRRLRGLHFYDGHQVGPQPERRAAIHAGYDALIALVTMLRAEGIEVPEIVTSGTPAFLAAAQHWPLRRLDGTVHRVSPGTVILHDGRSQELNPDFALQPAALLYTRVVSQPREGRFTCDAGSKSLAAEAGNPCAHVLGHPDWVPAIPSEEHLPIDVPGEAMPVLGEELLLIPRHVCPTVNLAEEILLLDGENWLGVAPVEARAHDLLPPWAQR